MAKLIASLAAGDAIFASADPRNGGCITWNVVETAWKRLLWGADTLFPAIKSRMCEI